MFSGRKKCLHPDDDNIDNVWCYHLDESNSVTIWLRDNVDIWTITIIFPENITNWSPHSWGTVIGCGPQGRWNFSPDIWEN
jgi:hypothetical protein